MENVFKTECAGAAALCTYVFGAPDIWLVAFLIVMVTDYLTGIGKGFILGNLSSRVGLKGIIKKVMYLSLIAVVVVVDNLSGAGGYLRAAVLGFFIANEALSITENCRAVGLPIPKMLSAALEKLLKGEKG